MAKYKFNKGKFRSQNTIINRRNWKSELYNKMRGRDIRKKWKNPKAGLKRKRYFKRSWV